MQAPAKEKQRSRVVYAGFFAAAAALVIFAWLAENVLRGQTLRFDGFVRETVHSWASPQLTAVLRSVTQLGSAHVLVVFCLVLIAGLIWMGRQRAAMVFAIGAGGGELLNELLKQLFHRTRPEPFFGFAEPPDYSFPSGHAVMSFCIYGVAAAIITTRMESRVGKALVRAAAALVAVLIGFSRIYLGVHYPSDVIAGFAAAIVWVTALWTGYGAWLRRFS